MNIIICHTEFELVYNFKKNDKIFQSWKKEDWIEKEVVKLKRKYKICVRVHMHVQIQNIFPGWYVVVCVWGGGGLKFVGGGPKHIFGIFFKFEFSREGPDALPSLPQGKKDPRMHSHKSMGGFRKYFIHSIEPKTIYCPNWFSQKRTRMT